MLYTSRSEVLGKLSEGKPTRKQLSTAANLWINSYLRDGGVTDAQINATWKHPMLYHAFKWRKLNNRTETIFGERLRMQDGWPL